MARAFPHFYLLMTKRVHFASTNVLYFPIPPTPSPTNSTTSLPSSVPHTPPILDNALTPIHYPRSPFEFKGEPLPDIPPGEMQIHFLLAFNPYSDPSVQYDLSLPPSAVQDQFPSQALHEPATQPPLCTLHILCPNLQWQFTVTSSSSQPAAFVTVQDVFTALYRALRLAVHPAEYESLPSFETTQEVNMAYYHRCMRVVDSEVRRSELSKGVKRVDFLMGRNRFMGLSGTLKGPAFWELNVS